MYIIPANGLKVLDPERGGYLPEGGREVAEGAFAAYWHRRISAGEVAIGKPPAAVAREAFAKEEDADEADEKRAIKRPRPRGGR